MSDRVSNSSEEPQAAGAWHAPKGGGGWHTPEGKGVAKAAWRRLTLPADIGATPDSAGGWHLPKPQDTSITEVEDALDLDMSAGDGLDMLSAEGGVLSQLVQEATLEAEVELDDSMALDDELAALEKAATEELSIVDETSDLTEAEKAMLAEAGNGMPTDAAEYARRALEELEGVAPPAAGAVAVSDSESAAEYAKRALQELGADTGDAPSAVSTSGAVLTEDAQKFHDAERKIASLRSQFNNGLMTRDEFQQRLREEMVLDDRQVWWMMGIESDKWYRFENDTWVPDVPSALGIQQRDPTRDEFVYPGLQNLSDSHVSEDTSQGEATGGVGVRGLPGSTSEMPLPVPGQYDEGGQPTVVGPAAYEQELDWAQPTVAGATVQGSSYDDTVLSGAYTGADYDAAIPDPRGVDYVQDYEGLDAQGDLYADALERQKRTTMQLLIIAVTVGAALMFVVGIILVGAGWLWYNGIVDDFEPQIIALADFQQIFRTVTIEDGAGNTIARLTSPEGGDRTEITLEEMSPYLIHAVVSIENERFYQDPGWDPIAIGRAFLQNIVADEIQSGASTITQQVARRLVLQDNTVSATRKINEIVIAQEISRRFTKDEILEIYLNEIFFGNQSYGVEAAAEFYFDKPALELNLPESAMIAGIIQNPATYNVVDHRPDEGINNPRQLTFDRMEIVLGQMVDVGCLQFQHAPYLDAPFCVTQQDVDQSLGQQTDIELTEFAPREFNVRYPHFVDFVRLQLAATFGETEMFQRGFTVHTTLNPAIQDVAQAQLAQQVTSLTTANVNTGAVMVTDPATGAIRAMVGSPDFDNVAINGQFNNTIGWNQPGSAIKPVVYTAALEGVDRNTNGLIEQGEYLTPASILWDVDSTISGYRPINFDRQFHGPVTVRSALQNSYNVPAVKAYQFIGNERFIDTATRMGFGFLENAQFNLTTGIGSTDVRLFDMMEAYGSIANTGTLVPLYGIESIVDYQDNPVQLPEELRRPPQQNAVSPQVSALMQSILTDDNARRNAFGVNTTLTIPGFGGLVAAKTGTSNDARDLWTMGFTTNAVVGVWLGNVNNDPTRVSGGFAAASPVWNRVMSDVLQRVARPQAFPGVAGIVPGTGVFNVCATTGTQPDQSCTSVISELFVDSQPPPPAAQGFVRSVAVDAWTGKLANEFCADNTTIRTFAAIEDPAAVTYLNGVGQQTAINLGLTVPLVFPPTQVCAIGDQQPIALLLGPGNGQTVTGLRQITGAVSAPDFNRYQLEVASSGAPDAFNIVVDGSGQQQGPFQTQQPTAGSTLGTWDSTTVPNGNYILRLSMFSNTGGNITEQVTVTVQNVLPTATPIPTAAPPVVIPSVTPIPFDATPIPLENLSPSPTPDVLGG